MLHAALQAAAHPNLWLAARAPPCGRAPIAPASRHLPPAPDPAPGSRSISGIDSDNCMISTIIDYVIFCNSPKGGQLPCGGLLCERCPLAARLSRRGAGGLPGLWGRWSPGSTRSRSSATSATSGSGRGSAASTRWRATACAPWPSSAAGAARSRSCSATTTPALGPFYHDAGPGPPRRAARAHGARPAGPPGPRPPAQAETGLESVDGEPELPPALPGAAGLPGRRCSIACSSRTNERSRRATSSAGTTPCFREYAASCRGAADLVVDRPCPHAA